MDKQNEDGGLIIFNFDSSSSVMYGALSIVIVLLLIWYFIRTNLEADDVCTNCGKKCRGHCRIKHGCMCKPCNSLIEGMFPLEDPAVLAHLPEMKEPTPAPIRMTPEGEEPSYTLQTGIYGDVPLSFFEEKDIPYGPEWPSKDVYMYVPNMRTTFQKVNTPVESMFWERDDLGIEAIKKEIPKERLARSIDENIFLEYQNDDEYLTLGNMDDPRGVIRDDR